MGKLEGDRDWIPDPSESALLRDHIASFLHSDPRRAEKLALKFLRLVQVRSRAVAPAVPAIAWRARAESLLYLGRYKAARFAYERACSLAAAAGEDHLLGQILVGRVGLLLAMGEFQAIGPMVRKAETLLRDSGDQDYLRRLHINLGSGHFHQERYDEADRSFASALRLMEETGQQDALWASLQLNHGIALSQLSRVEEARHAFRRTEEFGRANGQERLVAQAMFNQGVLEGFRGAYRAALRFLAEAEETFTRQEVRELLAATHLEQAQIYLDLSMATEGRELAGRAAAAFLEEGMLLDERLARLAEARSLLLLDRPAEAGRHLADAERFYRNRRLPARRSETLLEMARAALAQGDQTGAMRIGARALAASERLGLPRLRCAGRCLLADIHLRREDPVRAERALAGIGDALPSLPMRDRAEYWAMAARVARAVGHRSDASRKYRKALRCIEAQRALIPGIGLRAQSFERSVRVYHELIALEAASPRSGIDRVLRLMEQARGRAFREFAARRHDGDAHEAIAGRRAVLGSMVRRLDELEMGGKQPDRGIEAERLRRRILQVEREITAHVRRIESEEDEGTGVGVFRRVRQITPLLRKDETLIEYFVAEGRILAVVVGRGRRSLHTLDVAASVLKSNLDHLRLQLESLAATAARPLGGIGFLERGAEARLRAIHAMVLGPLIEDAPEGGRLTIVPHDILHQVPFECLHDGKGYVGDRRTITRCPTADFLIDRRRRAGGATEGGAVVVAGTRPGTQFIEEEARRVRACLGGGTELLVDPGSEEALEAMRRARIIHVSAHGSFRGDNPLFSTLHLGDGVLFLADILETPLAADLVVLSACNSGQTFSGRGDVLLGVAHAFLAAGARRLVASLWRVHDRATAEWMESFHQAYRGMSHPDPAAAQRSASRDLRARWPHPFYWGGFCVMGD